MPAKLTKHLFVLQKGKRIKTIQAAFGLRRAVCPHSPSDLLYHLPSGMGIGFTAL